MWQQTLASSLRLQAQILETLPILNGGDRPTARIAELRARADVVEAEPPPDVGSRVPTFDEWLRGIRKVDGDTALAREWVQPTGAHDAVRLGEYRSHNGVNWRSKIAANTTEPGSDPRWWVQEDPPLAPEPEDEEPLPSFPDWAPNISVRVDERYVYNGRVYRVIQAHTTQAGWVPSGTPALFADEGPAP